jgi:membrane-associated phospholipid phosphatase
MNLFTDFRKKKRRWILPVYAVIYLFTFHILETRSIPSGRMHMIHCPLDSLIPFCEVFILPYLSWFLFMLIAFLYFILFNDDPGEYYRFTVYMMTGMTVFLIISAVWPNGLALRPDPMPRSNIFTSLLQVLYASDTSTNVFPSIHVYNSLSVYLACRQCKKMRSRPALLRIIFTWAVLIICSTVFVKQHSVYDVCAGLTMSLAFYRLIYFRLPAVRLSRSSRIENRA